MENLLSFVFLFVIVLAFFGFKIRRTSAFGKRSDRTARGEGTQKKTQPFDAQTTKPQQDKRILEGAAYVIDGDTIVIKKTQIRLFGVDAPEMNHPYGKNAKWALASLCKGQIVRAEVTDTDDHGRTVARCYLQDGRDLSAEMVKAGLAIDWKKFSGGIYRMLETSEARKKLWLADARQKGRMDVWEKYNARQKKRSSSD